MKMREEIDALRTMGFDPIEVLILPRMLALVLALPILAFLGDISRPATQLAFNSSKGSVPVVRDVEDRVARLTAEPTAAPSMRARQST